MAGLWRYDLEDLTGTAAGLGTLQSSYDGATSSREAASSSFGSDKISGAVEEFVDSWSTKRAKQIESIGDARTALEACIETYREADAAGVRGVSSSQP